MSSNTFKIAVMPGDGIGNEVMDACIQVVNAATAKIGGPGLDLEHVPGGAAYYREHGTDLPDSSFEAARAADAILFGAMGLPEVRKVDGTEINPQLDLRFGLELYAGVRPVRVLPGAPTPLADPRAREIDLVLIRENTEGLFADIRKPRVDNPEQAEDRCLITRKGSERVIEYAFKLAERRARTRTDTRRVTCVDKANVLHSMAFFRAVFDEVRERHPDIEADYGYVDAMALNLVKRPWDYDVMVMENLLGDILSDLTAGIVGGLGMAPSGDIGDKHGLFQPSHGSAPDITGMGLANPIAMILSASMMLTWLGTQHGEEQCIEAGALIDKAVADAFVNAGLKPSEFGGPHGTAHITQAVLNEI
jgi:3-isopropylmalate dehydrogenase